MLSNSSKMSAALDYRGGSDLMSRPGSSAYGSTDHITAASSAPSLQAQQEIIVEKRTDTEGNILEYRYAKGKLLGKGGFAKCYVGTSLQSRTNYAIKLVTKASLVKARAKQKVCHTYFTLFISIVIDLFFFYNHYHHNHLLYSQTKHFLLYIFLLFYNTTVTI